MTDEDIEKLLGSLPAIRKMLNNAPMPNHAWAPGYGKVIDNGELTENGIEYFRTHMPMKILNKHNFTDREKQIAREMLGVRSMKDIAKKLGIATSTASYHAMNIYKKSKTKNRSEFTRRSWILEAEGK